MFHDDEKIEGPRKVGLFASQPPGVPLSPKEVEMIHNFYFRIVQVPASTLFVLVGIYY